MNKKHLIAALAALVILPTLVVCRGDAGFKHLAGFSPEDFGAQHYVTWKEVSTLQGYYEYAMEPTAFHAMKQALSGSAIWEFSTQTTFSFPQFDFTDSRNCDWFCTEMQGASTSHLWMAYDEQKRILYAGFFDH